MGFLIGSVIVLTISFLFRKWDYEERENMMILAGIIIFLIIIIVLRCYGGM